MTVLTATERRSLQRRSAGQLEAERDWLIREATIHALSISDNAAAIRLSAQNQSGGNGHDQDA